MALYMKGFTFLLLTFSLVACTTAPAAPAPTAASYPVTVTPAAPTTLPDTPQPAATSSAAEEAEVRNLVENFGKRLQNVSLLAPDAAQEMQAQYAEFVSPALLEIWMKAVSKAPGRMVSSPWPDRIEITTLLKEGSDRYVITGIVVEMTSLEVVSGGATVKIPVHIVAQKVEGRWLITEYAQEQ
jgi:hypothetical protein